jgi:hypothetical protein
MVQKPLGTGANATASRSRGKGVIFGQIQPRKPKIAMAVGGSRHRAIETIATRHPVQSAYKARIGRDVALAAIDELADRGPAHRETNP